ncbi:uncharacterized protein J3R85_009782 [Psidium guajava]|nr:uncharacterized protein J3R85_009782 [Psidium guajava]
MLTGTESSAERLEQLLAEKTESEPGSGSCWAGQMLWSESGFPAGSPASMLLSSLGKSRRSSMWSNKLQQSISSMVLGPVIVGSGGDFPGEIRSPTKCETMGAENSRNSHGFSAQ